MTEPDIVRKLTTIFAADVVGYSRMMSADEEVTIKILKGHRQIIDGEIEKHGGRIFATGGDSVLADFASTVEAIHCAVAVQDQLLILNRRHPPDRRMQFRIGINVGDVVVDGDDLLGDGVNIAARLEGICQPGGILISGSAYALVRGKVPYDLEDAGPQSVKNIPQPIQTYRVRLDGSSAPEHTEKAPARQVVDASQHKSAPTRSARRWIGAGAALAAACAVSTGVFVFLLPPKAEAELIGMTVYGLSRPARLPFHMTLEANGKAEVELPLNPGGAAILDTGRWWVPDDDKFCVHFNRFGQGRELCRMLSRKGSGFVAAAGDTRDDDWTIDRALVRTGMSVHGSTPDAGARFVVSLDKDGRASVEITGNDQSGNFKRNDRGEWWTEGDKFCFKFTRFSEGRERCRTIVKQDGKLMAVAPGNRAQDWEVRRTP